MTSHMSNDGRKSKIKKRRGSPRITSSTKTRESAPLPTNVAKIGRNTTVLTPKQIFIAAPVELCFRMIASQLEQPREWDLIVINARPVSHVRGQIGATSQVTLNVGGKNLDAPATISRYRPNRAMSWVLTTKPKVREDWRLELASHGTMVSVSLAYEVSGRVIGRFLDRAMRRKKLRQDLDIMLTHLKTVLERITRDQGVIGKWRL